MQTHLPHTHPARRPAQRPFRRAAGLLVLFALLISACLPVGQASPTPTAPPPEVNRPTRAPTNDSTPIPIGGATSVPASSTAAPTAAPARPVALDAEIAAIDASPRRGRDQLELARALGACRETPDDCPVVAHEQPLEVAVGDVRPFYVTDFDTNTQFEIEAELRYIGPSVLMYVEQGLEYDQADLEQAARAFEEEIYPRTREIFGSELQPGVDGDLRVTILNANDPSGQILGYYSSQDSLTRQVNRYSNEREMFFMNISLMPFDDPTYLDVLAHEFQHMIHQNEQPGSATWFNEGASQLSEDLNGFFSTGFTWLYLFDPDVQLTAWGNGPDTSGAHYGAAHLFMRYIYAQYAGEAQLQPLVRSNAGHNLQSFVELAAQTRPEIVNFSQIVADWAVANLIDDPDVADGRYTYATGHELPDLLPERVTPQVLDAGERYRSEVAQYGVDYLALPAGSEIRFEGATSAVLGAEMPQGRFAWWGGRSDDSLATLTRAVDLRGLDRATLEFETWYEIENDYDYAFVTVSTDGGRTWESLPGQLTTTYDPQGVNYGHGITGISGQGDAQLDEGLRGRWVEERIDLSPYAGQEILLRFWQINDQGFNAPGIMLDNLRIPELGFSDDVESDTNGWEAEGFVRVDGDLPQFWELRLIRTAENGQITVETLAVDSEGKTTARLAPDEEGVLVVIAATPHTTERAPYGVTVK